MFYEGQWLGVFKHVFYEGQWLGVYKHVLNAGQRLGVYKHVFHSDECMRTATWKGHILDFKQVFQFDSPQIFQILKTLKKMLRRYSGFQAGVAHDCLYNKA